MDALLASWLDVGSKMPSSVQSPVLVETIFHPASAVICLDNLIQQTESLSSIDQLLCCINCAILLSYDYCSKRNTSLQIDVDTKQILLIVSPANCLVVFKCKQSISSDDDLVNGSSVEAQSLLGSLGMSNCVSIEDGLRACQDQLTKLVSENLESASLPAQLLRALIPPDWTVLALARVSIGHV